jgi:hypothetical protein
METRIDPPFARGTLTSNRAVTEAPSPLNQVREMLEKTAVSLQEAFDRLRRKLQPVILAVPETKAVDQKMPPRGPRSDAVGHLESTAARLGMLVDEVEALIEHVEV